MELRDIQTFESPTSLYRDHSVSMDTPQQYSFVDKMKLGVRSITVEPLFFLYYLANLVAGNAIFHLTYEMTCHVNLKLNDTVCSDMSSEGHKLVLPLLIEFQKRNEEVQTASILDNNLSDLLSPGSTKQISAATIALVMNMCCATFSDQHKKRKPFIVVSLLGQVFSYIGVILCAVYISTWSLQYFYFMSLILPALFGGVQSMAMAIYSYVSDTTTQEKRTFKIGFVHVISLFANPIGSALADPLFLNTGYYGTFATCLILMFTAMVYAKVFVKEKRPLEVDCELLLEIFNPKTVVVDICNVFLKKRVGHKRFLLIMSYVCYILIRGPTDAEGSLFTDGLEVIQLFSAIEVIVGTFIVLPLFTLKLKMNDYLIAIISCISRIIVGICHAFGSHYIILFGSVINILSLIHIIALRSIITKLVNPSETAKSLAFLVACEVLQPLIFNDMYNKFFQYTKDSFKRSFFLFTSGLLIVPLILLFILYFLYKYDLKHHLPEEQEDEQQNETEQYNNDNEMKNL